jgi:hypothetical protein
MAAGSLMEKCGRVNSENLPSIECRAGRQDEVPSFPLHQIEKVLEAPPLLFARAAA